jgi:hypothetical protein
MDVMANRKRGLKKATIPVQTKTTTPLQLSEADIDAIINSPEFVELCRQDEEKKRRTEERRLARETKREAERDGRRRNPKSPIDAYYNYMESCPFSRLDPKERGVWKKANPTFEFDGVTYRDHWSPERSNSGKTTRWMGYLTGSDGSSILIKDDHVNNRRNDPERNWGLPE